VSVHLDGEGTEKWSDITRDGKGRRVGVLVDGQLVMAPTIMAHFSDGRVMVFYGLPEEDARSHAEKIDEQLLRYAK